MPLGILAALALTPAADAGGPVRLERDIVFRTVGGVPLKLDVAFPAGVGVRPAVVCLHGGAWRVGSRKDLSEPLRGVWDKSFIEELAAAGYVAVSASYRLSTEGAFPAQIEDCKTAVRFLRANAARFRIDPERIGAVGFSAGGHLACLLGTTGNRPEFDGPDLPGVSSRVKAVTSFFGPTDLTLYAGSILERQIFGPMLGGTVREARAAFVRASPVTYADRDSAPTIFIHGTADSLVPLAHSRKLHEKLKGVGVPSELLVMTGESHGWLAPEKVRRSTDAMYRFLGERLK